MQSAPHLQIVGEQLDPSRLETATAHKLARIFYRMWTTSEAYADLGEDYYEQQYQE